MRVCQFRHSRATSDYLDAEAIAEAVARPTMRFVPIKTDDQLDLQSFLCTLSGKSQLHASED